MAACEFHLYFITVISLTTFTDAIIVNRMMLNLTAVPGDMQTGAKEIQLNDNRLTDIAANVFSSFTQLSKLHLQNNAIATVSKEAFTGTALTYLDFYGNLLYCPPDLSVISTTLNMVNFDRNKFHDCASLTWPNGNYPQVQKLYVSGMDLGNQKLSVFYHSTPQLELLSAMFNNLTVIPSDLPSTVRYLYLSNNHITAINPGVFGNLMLLKLHLEGNQISFVSPQAFNQTISHLIGMFNITSGVHLARNNLTCIPDLSSIRHNLGLLDLSDNEMMDCDESWGDGLSFPHLKTLNINDNSLATLPCLVHRATNLEAMNAAGNNIDHVPDVTSTHARLNNLSFYENPLSCDCNAVWIRTVSFNLINLP